MVIFIYPIKQPMLSIIFPLVQKQDLIFQFIVKNVIFLIFSFILLFIIYRKQFKYSLRIFIFFIFIYTCIWIFIFYKNHINYQFAFYELGAIWLGIYGVSIWFMVIYLPIFLIEFCYFINDVVNKKNLPSKNKVTIKYFILISLFLFVYFLASLTVYLV
jgi:hypothetical protein